MNNKYIHIFRIENSDKIWDGLKKDIFIGKSCLNEMTEFSRARDEAIWDRKNYLSDLYWSFRIKI